MDCFGFICLLAASTRANLLLFTEEKDDEDEEEEEEEDDDEDEDDEDPDEDGGVKFRLDALTLGVVVVVLVVAVEAVDAVVGGVVAGVGLTFSKKLKSFKSGNNI
jgi:hypothetical protein